MILIIMTLNGRKIIYSYTENHIEGYCKDFSRLTKRNWYIDREYYHDSEDVINGEGDPDAVLVLT